MSPPSGNYPLRRVPLSEEAIAEWKLQIERLYERAIKRYVRAKRRAGRLRLGIDLKGRTRKPILHDLGIPSHIEANYIEARKFLELKRAGAFDEQASDI